MAYKQDEPPAYGQSPAPPQAAYGGYHDPYQQGQQQGYYQQAPPMGYAQQGQYPQGQYGQPPYGQQQYQQGMPPQGYFPGQQESKSSGIMTGLLAALACCCCLDCLF